MNSTDTRANSPFLAYFGQLALCRHSRVKPPATLSDIYGARIVRYRVSCVKNSWDLCNLTRLDRCCPMFSRGMGPLTDKDASLELGVSGVNRLSDSQNLTTGKVKISTHSLVMYP